MNSVESGKVARRRRLWRVILLLVACAGLAAFHPWILERVARGLVAPKRIRNEPISYLVLPANHLPTAELYDEISRQMKEFGGESRLLVVEGARQRIEQLGAVPTGAEIAYRESLKRNLPAEKIEILRTDAVDGWEEIRAIRHRLEGEAPSGIRILVGEFGSKEYAMILRRQWSESLFQRTEIWPVHDPRYDVTNWWKSRRGWKSFFGNCVSLFAAVALGEPARKWKQVPAEQYEKLVEATLFGAGQISATAVAEQNR